MARIDPVSERIRDTEFRWTAIESIAVVRRWYVMRVRAGTLPVLYVCRGFESMRKHWRNVHEWSPTKK